MSLRPSYLFLMCAFFGALAGASAAVFVVRGMGPSSSTPGVEDAPNALRVVSPESALTPEPELASRVVELERQVAALKALSERLVLRQRAEAIVHAEAADAVPAGSAPLDVADPVFEAAVADIIDRDIERRRTERQEERRQKRAQELERSITKLSQTLQLAPTQESELTQLLTSHWDKMSELRDDSNPNLNREQRRAQADALVKVTEEAVAGVLNPQQGESYRALPAKQKLKLGGRSEAENRPGPSASQ